MCLIIDRPAGIVIPSGWLDNALRCNADGWGIMSSDGDTLRVTRGMKPRGLFKALRRAGDSALTIHLRYATHGSVGVHNNHPFTILGGAYALAHNGIIDVPIRDKSRSDTWHFANDVVAPLLEARPDWFGTEWLEDLLSGIIGTGNKVVILRADGAQMVLNRPEGFERSGLWLSNVYSIAGPIVTSAKPVTTGCTDRQWGNSLNAWRDVDYAFDPYGAKEAAGRWSDASDDLTDAPVDVQPGAKFDRIDLADLDGLTREELSEYCAYDPDAMADVILRLLD